MANSKAIVALIIGATIAATLFMPINAAVNDNVGTQTIENETDGLTADYNTTQDLEGYNIVDGSETVERYNSTSGSWETLTAGTDYQINNEPGSIEILDTSATDAGDDIRVSYDYQATSGATTTVALLVPLFVALLVLVMLAAKVMEMM